MAEGQVTVDGTTRSLDAPFFVLATQNPVETIGCFPLPEAQLDRFIMKINMGSLTQQEEREMLDRYIHEEPLAHIEAVCTDEDIRRLQRACREVFIHDDLKNYIISLVQETRRHKGSIQGSAAGGVSPRGTLAFARAAQGLALVNGRDFVVPEDIKAAAIPVLSHRLIGEFEETRKNALIQKLLDSVALPTEDWSKR